MLALKNSLVIFADSEQVKNSFQRNSVTYGRPCYAIGHFSFGVTMLLTGRHAILVIYGECYEFEGKLFALRRFLPCTPSCWFQGFPGSRQFNLKVSRASCWSSKHSPSLTIRLNHNNPQNRYGGRFYLRVRGWLANQESTSYGIRNLFTIGEHVRSLTFYPLGHKAIQWLID